MNFHCSSPCNSSRKKSVVSKVSVAVLSALHAAHSDLFGALTRIIETNTPPSKRQRTSAAELVMQDLSKSTPDSPGKVQQCVDDLVCLSPCNPIELQSCSCPTQAAFHRPNTGMLSTGTPGCFPQGALRKWEQLPRTVSRSRGHLTPGCAHGCHKKKKIRITLALGEWRAAAPGLLLF